MRELELTVRIKNNRLLERREALGLSQKMMADVVGVHHSVYADLENLRRKAVVDGRWTEEALLCAEYYDCGPDELFPESLDLVRESVVERKFDVDEVVPMALSSHTARLCLPAPDLVDLRELDDRVEAAMEVLSPREREVVRQRYGLGGEEPMTYRQIGEVTTVGLGKSVERISTIHDQSIGKLRKYARDVLDGAPLSPNHRWSPPEEVPFREGPKHDFSCASELVVARPSALEELRSIRDCLVDLFPGRARVVADLSDTVRNKVNLRVFVEGLEEGRGGQVRSTLAQEIVLASASLRVLSVDSFVESVLQKRRVTSADRLVQEAVEGGFVVLGRHSYSRDSDVRMAVDSKLGAVETIFRMRLWFCDRAELVSDTKNGLVWRPTPAGRRSS